MEDQALSREARLKLWEGEYGVWMTMENCLGEEIRPTLGVQLNKYLLYTSFLILQARLDSRSRALSGSLNTPYCAFYYLCGNLIYLW